MITVRMRAGEVDASSIARAHRVAGHVLLTDIILPELAPFATGDQLPSVKLPTVSLPGTTNLVYRGPGWLASRWVDVECRSGPEGYWLTVAGTGRYTIAADGKLAALVEKEAGSQTGVVVETLLGPALILALALQDTWCLHASAVRIEQQAVAFLGKAGHGKSTLAAFLGAERGKGQERLADDILPVTPTSDGLDALPHFPQLKLSPEDQPSAGMPKRMPIRVMYMLDGPDSEKDGIDIWPLGIQEATLALVRHTIAARLFDKQLLAKHLSFCSEASRRVPVRRLAYPRRYEFLPLVRDAIAADLRHVR